METCLQICMEISIEISLEISTGIFMAISIDSVLPICGCLCVAVASGRSRRLQIALPPFFCLLLYSLAECAMEISIKISITISIGRLLPNMLLPVCSCCTQSIS